MDVCELMLFKLSPKSQLMLLLLFVEELNWTVRGAHPTVLVTENCALGDGNTSNGWVSCTVELQPLLSIMSALIK